MKSCLSFFSFVFVLYIYLFIPLKKLDLLLILVTSFSRMKKLEPECWIGLTFAELSNMLKVPFVTWPSRVWSMTIYWVCWIFCHFKSNQIENNTVVDDEGSTHCLITKIYYLVQVNIASWLFYPTLLPELWF